MDIVSLLPAGGLTGFDGSLVSTSLVLVFALLIVLCLVITLQGKIFDSFKKKQGDEARAELDKAVPAPAAGPAPAPRAPRPAPAPAPAVEAGIPGEVVAAIAAAVCASREKARSPMTVFSGLVQTSATGAKSIVKP